MKIRFLVLTWVIGALFAACAGSALNSNGPGESEFESGVPVSLPETPAKLEGGINQNSLQVTKSICPSGSGQTDCFATLLGSLLENTPDGVLVLHYNHDGECVASYEVADDLSFEVAILDEHVNRYGALRAVSSDSTCDNVVAATDPVYFRVLPNGVQLHMKTNEAGIASDAILSASRTLFYSGVDDDESSVLKKINFDDDLGPQSAMSLFVRNLLIDVGEDNSRVYGILKEAASFDQEDAVCRFNLESGQNNCDTNTFFQNDVKERSYDIREQESWLVANYKNDSNQMTPVILSIEDLSLYSGDEESILDVPSGEASGETEVVAMDFSTARRCPDCFFVTKVFSNNTSVLQRYAVPGILNGTTESSQIYTIYSDSAPMRNPMPTDNGVLVRCGADGSEKLCLINTQNTHPSFFHNQTTPTREEFGGGEAEVTYVTGIRYRSGNYFLFETDQGIFLREGNTNFATVEDVFDEDFLVGPDGVLSSSGGAFSTYIADINGGNTVWYADLRAAADYFDFEEGSASTMGIIEATARCTEGDEVNLLETERVTCTNITYATLTFNAEYAVNSVDGSQNTFFTNSTGGQISTTPTVASDSQTVIVNVTRSQVLGQVSLEVRTSITTEDGVPLGRNYSFPLLIQ